MNYKNVLWLILIINLLLCTNYCSKEAVQEHPITCDQVKSVKLGMTPAQVEALLGPPFKKDFKRGVVHYLYNTTTGIWIIKIQEGKVVDSANLSSNC